MGGGARSVVWLLSQGRRVDGAPTLRIPSCAGEHPSFLTSANTRPTEPREIGLLSPTNRERNRSHIQSEASGGDLTRPAGFIQAKGGGVTYLLRWPATASYRE